MNLKTTLKVKVILNISFFLLISFSVNAQERTCGMVEVMQEKMKDPEYARQYKKTQAKFKAQLEKNIVNLSASKMMSPILIPVAVHFPSGLESDRACLEALAQNQIDILNADFTGTNADFSAWSEAAVFYPNTNPGSANILFCIATTNHPTGLDPEMIEGGPAVTIGYNFGNGTETDAAWSGYMNFLVKDIGEGFLGFSPLAGSITNGDSVTMNLGAFGSGDGCPASGIVPAAPFNLGRTVTHELGHFYNLEHSFSGSCTTDDGIVDTPNQKNPSGGCPVNGSIDACVSNEKVLSQNYMDYTDDSCMFMFSSGQIAVAEAFIMTLQSQFKTNVASCNPSPNFVVYATEISKNICLPTNEVTYGLSYIATGNNTNATSFSATNLPAGVTATFNPTSTTDTANVTMTLGNLDNLTANIYSVTITATGVETKNTDVILRVDTAAPTTPNLVSPINGNTNTTLTPNLTWDSIENKINYTLEIATDNTFTTNVTSNVILSNTFETSLLDASTQYFWRVKSTNACGDSFYSTVYNFTTAATICSTFNSTQNNIGIPETGDEPHVITSLINITTDMDVEDINVTVNIQHAWSEDIELMLTSPSGTEVIILASSTCNDGTDDIAVIFDNEATSNIICSTTAPSIGGIAKPSNSLSLFNGEKSSGDWLLTIIDVFPREDGGTFLNFSIDLCGSNSTLNVDEFNLEKELKLWPNPSSGDINISLETKNNNAVNIDLYDLRGRLISSKSFKNSGFFSKKLNYSNLEGSVYLLSIENNGQKINKRVIIE